MDQAQQQKLHHVRILVRSNAAGPKSSHRQLLGASQIFATHTAMQRKTTDQQRTVFDESIPRGGIPSVHDNLRFAHNSSARNKRRFESVTRLRRCVSAGPDRSSRKSI